MLATQPALAQQAGSGRGRAGASPSRACLRFWPEMPAARGASCWRSRAPVPAWTSAARLARYRVPSTPTRPRLGRHQPERRWKRRTVGLPLGDNFRDAAGSERQHRSRSGEGCVPNSSTSGARTRTDRPSSGTGAATVDRGNVGTGRRSHRHRERRDDASPAVADGRRQPIGGRPRARRGERRLTGGGANDRREGRPRRSPAPTRRPRRRLPRRAGRAPRADSGPAAW